MDPNDALACRNKVAMRTRLDSIGHVNPKFSAVHDRETLMRAAEYIGFPSVLKPAAGSASRGIFIVNNTSELKHAFLKLQNIISKTYDAVFSGFEGKMILEEMLNGPEISVEGFVHNKQVSIVGITDKWVSSQFKIEVCHVHPSKINGAQKKEIYDYSSQVVAALGIDNTPFHLEAKLTPNGFKVIECAARPAGDCITTNVLPLTLLGPHVENCIRSYIGEAPIKINKPKYYAASKFIFADKNGVFIGISNLDKVLA
ncbi:acetyl-CoA carboxylase biotin carboxylase subunit family protein, partial [Bartonella sp. CL42QHWL]